MSGIKRNGGTRRQRGIETRTAIIIILALLLSSAVAYIAEDKYHQFQDTQRALGAQEGFKEGYQKAILEISQLASTCQQVPLVIGNTTLNVVAVDCLRGSG